MATKERLIVKTSYMDNSYIYSALSVRAKKYNPIITLKSCFSRDFYTTLLQKR